MAVYAPVIRLPPKRKPSLMHNSASYSNYTPKEYLVSDTLFLDHLPANIKETDLRTLLQHCLPKEIVLDRENNSGQLRFSDPKYADRAYSLYNGFTFTNQTKLELQMYQDKRLDPEATAALLEVNNLPEHYDDNLLYDLFRPFGCLNLCKCILFEGAFRGTAFVQFFYPSDSDEAIETLDGFSVEGNLLSVVQFMPSKSQYQEESVDTMNLYIKNLEPYITNYELSQAFRKFGRIVSAKVMTNPATGQSKGYGFVSYGKSEDAAAALKEMNGSMLGNRPLIVAYHEPKKGKQTEQKNYVENGMKSTTIVHLPQRKNSDQPIKSSPQFSNSSPISASTGKSLASLASGLSIQPPPPTVNLGQNGRRTLRRRGSLESVMTESSASIQRTKLIEAVQQCGDYGKDVDDIVDMLLTLKRKERSLCLFNSDFLKEKVDLALEALATCVDSEEEEEEDLKPKNREVELLLASLEGKPVHEKKQLLGDKLFPLVKSTGTKQAPKVTICLLDTVDLHELAYIMYDTPLLKIRVEEAFNSLHI